MKMLPRLFVATAALAASATALAPGFATASTITFKYTGVVASFVDTDNVYGFGAGADLAGASVTDTYVIDTSSPGSMFTSGGLGVGGAFESWNSNLPAGLSSFTSTINGHSIGSSFNVFDYSEHLSSPTPYDYSLIESQSIGFETTGTAVGSEFLVRDEAESFSHIIPLSLSAGYYLTNAKLTAGTTGEIFSGVYFPFSPDATPGAFDMTFVSVNGVVPEPAVWEMMLFGFLGLGAVARGGRRRLAIAKA